MQRPHGVWPLYGGDVSCPEFHAGRATATTRQQESLWDRARRQSANFSLGRLRWPTGLRQSGRVKWFNASKGYGFITPDDDGSVDDLYFHQTAIQMDGFRVPDEGDPVTFVVGPGPKGLQATDVRLNSDLHSA